jgi:hypothetical protein
MDEREITWIILRLYGLSSGKLTVDPENNSFFVVGKLLVALRLPTW